MPEPYATPAMRARERAGLSVVEAAKRARICVAYLRRVERNGGPYALARRLAALYQCPIDVFLPSPLRKEGSRTPKKRQPAGRGRSRRQAPSPRAKTSA